MPAQNGKEEIPRKNLPKPEKLVDRMKVLLNTANGADIHFLVGEEKQLFRAHKHILVLASDVFEAMFRIDAKNTTEKALSAELSNPVEVPDVEAAAFKVMLSFIYAEDLSELNGQNAMAVLYAAKKYNIPALVDQCLKIPIPRLRNVFLAYAQTRLSESEEFAHKCLRYICQKAETLFKSTEFLRTDQNLLCRILERDQLVLSDEFEIWKAAIRWADEKCRKNAIECSAANRRSALGPALFKIRFPLITLKTFAKEIVPSGVLTLEEVISVYQYHSHPDHLCGVPELYPMKFPCHGRISDWNIAKGNRRTLAMEIEKLSEFAREEEGTERYSEVVQIKGFQLNINAQIEMNEQNTAKCLGIYLYSAASEDEDEEDENWRCKCSATFRIVSQKGGIEDLIGQINFYLYDDDSSGFENFINFSELMNTSKGFYEKEEDKVTLAIDVFVEEEKLEKFESDSNKSNGKIVMEIGKLAEFAREICGSERSSETIQIKGLPWKILAEKEKENDGTGKSLAFYLWCTSATEEDENWSCKCSGTFRIVSQMNGAKDFTRKFNGKEIFTAANYYQGFDNFITFAELMDPSKGLYDRKADKVKLAIDFSVEEINSE
ncbi:hypothetical protein niasHS_017078 [Heterodera schachtii]|uniref:BTB domain-containing protein n=1 Tax=Heterodera schachtii TaxID=97005 RepID=A0ABD2I7W1_HETSC